LDLAGEIDLKKEATGAAKPKPAAEHKLVGKSVPRRDIPKKKFTGGAAYVQDIRLPKMVFGRVVRPPSPGATLISVDENQVKKMPGVVAVVRDGSFLAVAARARGAGDQGARGARQSAVVEGKRHAAALRQCALRTHGRPERAGAGHARQIRRPRRRRQRLSKARLHAPFQAHARSVVVRP